MPPNQKRKRKSNGRGCELSRTKRRSRRLRSRRKKASDSVASQSKKQRTPENTHANHDEPATGASAEKKARKRRRKKRIPIGEALRKQGLGEHEIADSWVEVVKKLKGKAPARINEKLLVDVLKECSRQVEAVQQTVSGPVQVKLVHNVERPTRKPGPPEGAPESKEGAEESE